MRVLSLTDTLGRHRAVGLLRQAIFWAAPALLILIVYFSPRHLVSAGTLLTGLAALSLVILAARRPDLSLLGLIVILPFQGLILAKLWASGVPPSIVSHMGAWKETLAIGVILAGLHKALATRRRLDLTDRLALAFVLLTALYAALQAQIVPGAPSASNIRLLGFRETGGFVLLLLGARHAPLPRSFATRATGALFASGVAVSAIGIYEWAHFSGWNNFVVHTVKYTQYQIAVLHTQPPDVNDIGVRGVVGGVQTLRIGSVFLNSLSLGWYLILPFAIGFERIVRRIASPPVVVGTVLIGIALLRTETRSAIIGALIVALLGLAPAAGRGGHWRSQVAVVMTLLLVIAVPATFATGAARRIAAADNTGDTSTAGHLSGLSRGLDTLAHHLLGQGLGTGAGTGQRFGVRNVAIPENNYLEVGDELGLLPMVVFTALTLALIAALRGRARLDSQPLLAATWAAAVGLAVAAYFLQTWSDFAVAWTFWGLAGVGLGLSRTPYLTSEGFPPTELHDGERRTGRPLSRSPARADRRPGSAAPYVPT